MNLNRSSIVLVAMTASQGGRAIAVFAWTALAVRAGAGLLMAGASAGARLVHAVARGSARRPAALRGASSA
jgi:hypothetical protein